MFHYSMVMFCFHSRLDDEKQLGKVVPALQQEISRKCFGVVFTCANFLVVGCALPYLLPKYLPIVHIGHNMVCGNKTSCKHGAWNMGFLLE